MAPNAAIHSRASLKVVERSVLARSPDTIANTPDGVDQRIAMRAVDLATEAPDINIDDVSRRIEMQVPYVLQQHCAGHDVPGVANHVFEQLEFARQQLDSPPAPCGRPIDEIQLQIANPQHGFLDDRDA